MISIVMPAHNEREYLRAAVEELANTMRGDAEPFEVIIVENGSTDGTQALAAALEVEFPEVTAISLGDPDYGLALRSGFMAAHGEIVVNFDVDFVDPEFLRRAVGLMADERVAVVVGSKRSPGAEDNRSLGRRAVTSIFGGVLRYVFGLKVSDTHGIKALRRRSLSPVVQSCRFNKDIFDTELILRAERGGLTVTEIPVAVSEVRAPRSSIARRIPRTLYSLARLRIALVRHR